MASELFGRIEEVMGEFPGDSRRVPLDIEIVEEREIDGLHYTKLTYASEVDDRCIAWLIRPDGGNAVKPACLCLHQTITHGKDEPAGLEGNPHFHYAKELAQRGYVTLATDYPNFGEYSFDTYERGYASGTMKGIWNHVRAIDLLSEREDVDADRIGCIGHSLGGHNTLFLTVFDVRVKVAVSSCGFTNWTRNDDEGRGVDGDLSDWTGPVYMPRIRERYNCRAENMPFTFEELLGLVDGRPMFLNAPKQDFMRYDGVLECLEYLRPMYESSPEKLVGVHPDCEHDFPDTERMQAYEFIDRHLKG